MPKSKQNYTTQKNYSFEIHSISDISNATINRHNNRSMPSSSFGSWYDEQKAAENGGSSNSSWFSIDSEQALPLFNSENLPGFSMESMRETMEAQMPKKILGMGYQQRFKVNHGMFRKRTTCYGLRASSCREFQSLLTHTIV